MATKQTAGAWWKRNWPTVAITTGVGGAALIIFLAGKKAANDQVWVERKWNLLGLSDKTLTDLGYNPETKYAS